MSLAEICGAALIVNDNAARNLLAKLGALGQAAGASPSLTSVSFASSRI